MMEPHELSAIWNLANLIEQGSKDQTQITGRYRSEEGVCCIGACFRELKVWDASLKPIKDYLGVTSFPDVIYPAGVAYWVDWADITKPVSLDTAIIMLNDVAGWNFARIVQWLRDLVLSDAGATETAQNA